MYLKFVWGRSRLPIDMKGMRQQHTVTLARSMGKTALPEAHTCFFEVDLPEYADDKTMKEKILIAVTMCGEIDLDG